MLRAMVERAFVAGATGYTGQAVVEVLRARGADTVAHVRPDSSSMSRWRETFAAQGATVDATPWALDPMTASMAAHEPDVVFALLGTTRRRAAHDGMDAAQGYEAVDYGLTALLLEACARAVPRARFVYLSSLGVEPDTTNAYLAARARVERMLRDGRQPYTIARPSFITGPDRSQSRPAERVAAMVADAALTVLGWVGGARIRDRYASMDAHTLARGLVRAAFDPEATDAVLEAPALRR